MQETRKRERMQVRRAKLKTGKCPTCGRKSAGDVTVPRHNPPRNFNNVPRDAESRHEGTDAAGTGWVAESNRG